jgi:hypothetical protein
MTTPADTARPVQLQANLNGAWKAVLRFDAGDEYACAKVEQGARMLHQAAPFVSFRIATTDSVPLVLRHISRQTGGIWTDRNHA